MTWKDWYDSLAKPEWTAKPSTIGLIWQIIYPIILITFGFVFVQAIRKKLPWTVALPFGINLVANLIFTPIQFGLRNLPLAALDILIVREQFIGRESKRSYLVRRFVFFNNLAGNKSTFWRRRLLSAPRSASAG